jgi:DNA-binding CsgD family transcriptional regulator
MADRTHLTDREKAILRGLAAGQTRRQIAHDMGKSPATVEPHIRAVLSLLGARNDAHAVDIAHRAGLLDDVQPQVLPPPVRRQYDPPAVTRQRRQALIEAMDDKRRTAA